MTDLGRRRREKGCRMAFGCAAALLFSENGFPCAARFAGARSAPINGFDMLWGRHRSRRNPYILLYLMYPQAMPKEFRLLTG